MTTIKRIFSGLVLLAILALPVPGGQEREGGIIGTGIEAGIFGVVTRLGSIWVNGQHITFDPDLPVLDAIGPKRAADLKPGYTVAVSAVPDGKTWRALQIRQVLPLVGPVSFVTRNGLFVLGTRVVGRTNGVRPGDWVAVSGVWRENEVVASHLGLLPAGWRTAQVMGTYLGKTASGHVRIGNTRLEGFAPQHLQPGDVVRATGTAGLEGVRVKHLEKGLFGRSVRLVQAEGYFSPPRPDGLYTVLGSGLVAYTKDPYGMSLRVKAIACGRPGSMQTTPDAVTLTNGLARRLGCP